MAEVLATMAIRPLVSMLMNKSSSYLLDQYNVMDGMEEQHKILKRKLPAILDVITDAEEQVMAHRLGAKAWLQEVKTVAYEANQVFDEFKYEALRRQAKKNGHYTKHGFDSLFPTHNRIVFRYKMGRKLCMILKEINVLIAEMHDFGLRQTLPMSSQFRQKLVSKQWRQTDYVIIDPKEIASRSRNQDKKNIVDILLAQASNADLAAVPIVGMGGLGKTTLAQLIYNEPEIQKHFQLLLWVCVSDIFDVNSLAKSIVEASPKKNEDTDKPPLDRLQKLVSGQRYLLVLDDVWNREIHKWEKLKVYLQHGGTGSAVLTTTRDKRVAQIMGTDRAYNLNAVEDSFLKEIIETRAFSLKKEKPYELVNMVDEIVKRCCGFPLAAAALGSVLRNKTSVEEWKDVLSRSNKCTEQAGILPILMLSYNDLPSYMKQCFAFCAIFPRGYRIDVEKLIQLWIANGFIPEYKEYTLETTGKHIFGELASRSFFLDIEMQKTDWEYFSRTTCKIHDLLLDIALSVMEKQSVDATEEPIQIECLPVFPDTARHLFLAREEPNGICLSREETEGISNEFVEKRPPVFRTLICDSFMGRSLQHMKKYSSLHALKLHIGRESFLPKRKYLRYLRYLDLSGSFIKSLPEDISILYNLQVLDLSNCADLARLPRKMKYMTSLRHLYTHGCLELQGMPPGLRKLMKLQTITCFVAAVPGSDCSDVAELQHLNLGGRLELCRLENVKEEEAELANLGKKKDLRELTLRWSYVCDSMEVLKYFEPHNGLQVLRIYSYGGNCIGMLQNMVEIHLFHCERLQFLFGFCASFNFPRLEVLTLDHLLGLERCWETNERQEDQIMFPVLEKLFIRHCGKLTALPEGPLLEQPCHGGNRFVRSAFPALKVLALEDLESFQRWDGAAEGKWILFPQLEKLSIQKCPKIIDLPEAPKLSVLKIEGAKQEIFHFVDRYLSLLTKLTLKLENTETTPEAECTLTEPVNSKEKWNQKSPLTAMELRCCNSFLGAGALEPLDYFVHLEDLEIDRCDVLVHWPEKAFQSLVSLRRLVIKYCKNLTGYAQPPPEPSVSGRSQQLPGLESLCLWQCESLVEMFDVPASLKRMSVHECPELKSIFGKQQGNCSELPSSPMNHFCPCLEDLHLSGCGSLPAVLNLPPSLKTIFIFRCSSIQVLSCQLGGLEKPEVTTSINVPEPSAAVAAAQEHSLPPCLQSLKICEVAGMLGGILRLPMSLKELKIESNSGLTSLEFLSAAYPPFLSAEYPPSLESLCLENCSTLASLPNEPQAYRSLQSIEIKQCPAIKKLPICLQQQLGSIDDKQVDAQYEVMALKPKTWKEIPRLVREWKAGGEARELKQAMQE